MIAGSCGIGTLAVLLFGPWKRTLWSVDERGAVFNTLWAEDYVLSYISNRDLVMLLIK